MDTNKIITQHVNEKCTVLDIGARDGSSTNFLRENGYDVHAYDPEPVSDLVKPGKLGDDFGLHGLVVARLLVHLVPTDLNTTLDTLWSYVEPGGYLYFTNFDKQDIWFKESADEWLKDKTVVEHKLEHWVGKKYDGSSKDWFVNEYLVKKF